MKLLIVSLILIIAVVGSIVFGRVRQARKRSLADWAVGGVVLVVCCSGL